MRWLRIHLIPAMLLSQAARSCDVVTPRTQGSDLSTWASNSDIPNNGPHAVVLRSSCLVENGSNVLESRLSTIGVRNLLVELRDGRSSHFALPV